MYLLFDIGGTKMRFATSSDGEELENIQLFETPPTFEESIQVFERYYSSLPNQTLTYIWGALPGIFNEERTEILKCKNLPGWVEKPIVSEIEQLLGAKVALFNDAKMAGLGEAVLGAGKGYKVVAYLTVSTGVGGARIVDGELNEDSMRFEPGHQIIDYDGSTDPSFLKPNERYDHAVGTLERFISGKDLSLKYGKPMEEISDKNIWDNIARYLSIGISNILIFWMPDVVVLGGGISLSENLSVENIEKYLDEYLTLSVKKPDIKKAELGDLSGLYGAMKMIDKLKL